MSFSKNCTGVAPKNDWMLLRSRDPPQAIDRTRRSLLEPKQVSSILDACQATLLRYAARKRGLLDEVPDRSWPGTIRAFTQVLDGLEVARVSTGPRLCSTNKRRLRVQAPHRFKHHLEVRSAVTRLLGQPDAQAKVVEEGNDLVIARKFVLETRSVKFNKIVGCFDELGKAVSCLKKCHLYLAPISSTCVGPARGPGPSKPWRGALRQRSWSRSGSGASTSQICPKRASDEARSL